VDQGEPRTLRPIGFALSLSDSEWAILAPLIPPGKHGGRLGEVELCHTTWLRAKFPTLPGAVPHPTWMSIMMKCAIFLFSLLRLTTDSTLAQTNSS
jgi:hypothetical protein